MCLEVLRTATVKHTLMQYALFGVANSCALRRAAYITYVSTIERERESDSMRVVERFQVKKSKKAERRWQRRVKGRKMRERRSLACCVK